jgi:flagellar biosynthesis anti-sigma factor FlgM
MRISADVIRNVLALHTGRVDSEGRATVRAVRSDSSEDRLELSPEFKALRSLQKTVMSLRETDPSKVQAVAGRLTEGTYSVEPAEVAQRMLF